MHNHIIAFFSPAGSTRCIAKAIHHRLSQKNCTALLLDLGKNEQAAHEVLASMLQNPCCLWIGSPVYCNHAVPLVHTFIDQLPAPASRCHTPCPLSPGAE